jgi:hypothetical protein
VARAELAQPELARAAVVADALEAAELVAAAGAVPVAHRQRAPRTPLLISRRRRHTRSPELR